MFKRKRRIVAQLLSNNSGSNGIQSIFSGASFRASLTYTAVPQFAASGTTATFTRATTKTWQNNDGYLVTGLAGEIGFVGARRVRNVFSTGATEGITWNLAGTSPPTQSLVTKDGKANVLAVVFPSGAASRGDSSVQSFGSSKMVGSVVTGQTYVYSCLVALSRPLTGAENIRITVDGGVGAATALNLTTANDPGTTLVRVSKATVFSGPGSSGIYIDPFTALGSALTVYVTEWQLENVTAQTTQTAGPYVSVGVASAPYYHGSMVDGVKCFPTDISGNPLPTSYTYDAVSLNGVAGTYVSTPDSVANSITGDIDIRVKAALTDWTPATTNILASKWQGAGASSFIFYVDVVGKLAWTMSTNGTAVADSAITSSVVVGAADLSALWVRVTKNTSTGLINFYTSADGESWTQLGTANLAGSATAIFNSAFPLELGSYTSGALPLNGKIYQAQIYNGINGTLAVDFNAARYAGGTTLTGSTGETWTLNGNAVIHPTNSPNLGYSAEGAATNLCLQSNAFATAPWTDGGTPVVSQNVIGPDGAVSAWTFTDNNGAAVEAKYISTTLTAAAYTASVFIGKTVGATTFPVLQLNSGANAFCTVNTNDGVATKWTSDGYGGGSIAGVSVLCASFNDDFWRIGITFTATAAAYLFVINPAATTNATQSSGTMDAAAQGSAVFYGAQVELGSSASSYIATTTTAVTRNLSVLNYTISGNASNTAGWSYAEVTDRTSTSTVDNKAIIAQGNRAFLGIAVNSNSIGYNDRGTTFEPSSLNCSPPFSDPKKIATSWGGTTGAGALSGTVATAAFDGDMQLASLYIGNNGSSVAHNGTIRNIRIGQRQLSSSELQAVTR